MSRKMSRVAALFAATATVVALAGPAAAAAGDASVRVLHASPDAPAVDVYVNGAKVGAPLAGLEFGDLSTYVALPAGSYDFKVCASADASICPIVANGVALTAGTHYTIAATNVLASIEVKIITDAPAPVADMTQVRVVHFSADTPAVDVLTQDGSAKVVTNLAYPDATGYLTLTPGSYDLKVCANADNTVCPLDPGALALEAGRSYSVFAIGSLAGSTLTAAVGVDAVATPATDTIDTPASVVSTSPLALLLIGAGIVSLLGAARLVTRRIER
jgi:hypothetical protein